MRSTSTGPPHADFGGPRVTVALLVTALVLALVLPRSSAWLPPLPEADVVILTVVAPTRVLAGEPVAVYAGVALPDSSTTYRVRVCGEACWTARRGTIPGPGDWWGRLTQLQLDPGAYRVTLHLQRPWGRLGNRTVASHEWEVSVH